MPAAKRSPLSSRTGAPAAPAEHEPPAADVADPRVEALVHELIDRVADKWTMLVLEVLAEHGELRFTRLGELVTGVSPKMLTQTVRQMERDGLLVRTIHPVIPPRVEYRLTDLGLSLGAAFCGVWIWAERHLPRVADARRAFDERATVDRTRDVPTPDARRRSV